MEARGVHLLGFRGRGIRLHASSRMFGLFWRTIGRHTGLHSFTVSHLRVDTQGNIVKSRPFREDFFYSISVPTPESPLPS